MAKKSLDDDDITLWKKVAETVTPIAREDFIIPEPLVSSSPIKPAVTPKVKPTQPQAVLPQMKKKLPSLLPADLDQKGYGGISRAAAKSMKSGQSQHVHQQARYRQSFGYENNYESKQRHIGGK